ncbi:MAG: hypothetical protein WEB03_16090 [Nitriliruptor sp.]|uniref:hypothetical protein n=1 Tax=Nitriliruptor sp. TaxID=2448056 RepID=UPI0034A078FF
MESVIYQATDLKDRRTELLSTAVSGRALVRAVDGTALVFTRLDQVEADRFVAAWSLDLHQAETGRLPSRLRWLRHLDAEDRAECVGEFWEELEDVAAGGVGRERFAVALAEWCSTALSLADSNHREVLLGDVSKDDFVPAEPPR